MKELNEIQDKVYQAYPTYQQFLASQEPKMLLVNFSEIHEVADAISTRRLSIAEMMEIYGTDSFNPGIDYFAKWLSFFNKFSNINNVMPMDTIQWVAIHLCTKYCHFYFADLKVIFEHLLESKYGKFYGSIDTVRIMSGFLEYNESRNRVIHQVTERQKNEYEVWLVKRRVEIGQVVFLEIEKNHPDMPIDERFRTRERITEERLQKEAKKLFPSVWQNK